MHRFGALRVGPFGLGGADPGTRYHNLPQLFVFFPHPNSPNKFRLMLFLEFAS